MIGREIAELEAISAKAERSIDRTGAPVLRATGIGPPRRPGEAADLDVYEGEVVGIAGPAGLGPHRARAAALRRRPRR